MHIELDRSGTVEAFEKMFRSVTENPQINGAIILACDANGFTPENIDNILRSSPIPLIGGIFPGILHAQEKIESGTIIIGLSKPPSITTVQGVSNPDTDFEELLEQQLDEKKITDTILIFADGFSSRISSFINALFINIGLEKNIIGGGAGSLSLEKRPYIITSEGLLADALSFAFIDSRSSLSVSHGWRPVKGPFKVTEADRNIIKSLDWMPALDIYREAIRSHSGQYITEDNFTTVAMSYPFGIARVGCEPIVRDPVKIQNKKELVCVGEVMEGSFVDVLHGNIDSLIEASRSISSVHSNVSPGKNSVALIVDCISRSLFLGDRFTDELNAIHLPDIPLVGILSFGEIATKNRESLEFHNKTTVLSILEEL